MSRTFKDRKGYKTKKRHHSYSTTTIYNSIRGSYDDYDHSDEELYVYDQSCDNCRYRSNCHHTPFPSGWCEYWCDGRNGRDSSR